MAISEFEIKRCERELQRFMENRRPPPHIRDKLDFGYRIKDQSVELFEIRPRWDNPSEKLESSIAKTTYVKSKKIWKVFWKRADLKWHGYEPKPAVGSIEEFLELVSEDEYGCFFG
jgi:hypothetical protein